MIPVKYHLTKDLMPDKPTRLQLENAAADKDAFDHIVVMPDVHPKPGRKCPTGTVLASLDKILPQVMDTAPNCGMRLYTTPWGQGDLKEAQIEKLFNELVKAVPTRTYIGSLIDKKTVMGICRFGEKALLEFLGEDPSKTQNVFKQGNFFDTPPTQKDILDAIPKIFLWFARFRLGIQGEAGNHFLDLMKIDEVLDKEKAEILGLKKDQYVFLSHTGSGVMGQYCSYFFTPKKEEHLSMKIITNLGRLTFNSKLLSKNQIKELQKEVKKYREKIEFFKIDPDSKRGKAYLLSHWASANFGFANRSMIMYNIKKTIKKVFQKQVDFNLICDIPHVFVDREKHFGRQVWVHRNGATRAFGPSRMKQHPVFSQTGELGILAGSMSTPSYLMASLDQNDSTFYSINHGAGRKKKISEAAVKTKEELMKKMKKNKVKLYNAKSKGVIQQASGYYKNIDEIVKINKDFNISTPVVKLSPKSVLMA
ncbi:MAG: hypothetical protein GF335_04790 [Candidatus Moranbacteria bacterium]|nr:hypothetical protein [Candidatus Moranbacteria bacterium]